MVSSSATPCVDGLSALLLVMRGRRYVHFTKGTKSVGRSSSDNDTGGMRVRVRIGCSMRACRVILRRGRSLSRISMRPGSITLHYGRWGVRALAGGIRLGRVFVRAGKPVVLTPGDDVRKAVLEVSRSRVPG